MRGHLQVLVTPPLDVALLLLLWSLQSIRSALELGRLSYVREFPFLGLGAVLVNDLHCEACAVLDSSPLLVFCGLVITQQSLRMLLLLCKIPQFEQVDTRLDLMTTGHCLGLLLAVEDGIYVDRILSLVCHPCSVATDA